MAPPVRRPGHIFPWLARFVGEPTLGRHLPPDTIDLGRFQAGDEVFRRANAAIIEPGSEALIDKALAATLHRLAHLSAEARLRERRPVG